MEPILVKIRFAPIATVCIATAAFFLGRLSKKVKVTIHHE